MQTFRAFWQRELSKKLVRKVQRIHTWNRQVKWKSAKINLATSWGEEPSKEVNNIDYVDKSFLKLRVSKHST